jgi:hypothetical protein
MGLIENTINRVAKRLKLALSDNGTISVDPASLAGIVSDMKAYPDNDPWERQSYLASAIVKNAPFRISGHRLTQHPDGLDCLNYLGALSAASIHPFAKDARECGQCDVKSECNRTGGGNVCLEARTREKIKLYEKSPLSHETQFGDLARSDLSGIQAQIKERTLSTRDSGRKGKLKRR